MCECERERERERGRGKERERGGGGREGVIDQSLVDLVFCVNLCL